MLKSYLSFSETRFAILEKEGVFVIIWWVLYLVYNRGSIFLMGVVLEVATRSQKKTENKWNSISGNVSSTKHYL